jgi:hypothetical protein
MLLIMHFLACVGAHLRSFYALSADHNERQCAECTFAVCQGVSCAEPPTFGLCGMLQSRGGEQRSFLRGTHLAQERAKGLRHEQ